MIAARSLAGFLYGVSTSDLGTFVVSTFVLLMTALRGVIPRSVQLAWPQSSRSDTNECLASRRN
jgi:hypothetical protein